ncbi:hypothetical protein XANCAGTX0491_006141 [Xanthoria calcicola]
MPHSRAVQDALRKVQDAAQADSTGSGQAHVDFLEAIRKLNLASETPAETLMRMRSRYAAPLSFPLAIAYERRSRCKVRPSESPWKLASLQLSTKRRGGR